MTDIAVDSLTARRQPDGTPVVAASVHNTGKRAIDLRGEISLSNGPGGLSAGPFPAELGTTLAIDGTGAVEVMLDKSLPDGPWDARAVMRSGQVDRIVTGRITFPQPGTAAPPVKADPLKQHRSRLRLFGIIAAVLLALLIALLLALLERERRRRRRRRVRA